MKSKAIISLIKSYLLTLIGSAACMLTIYLLFHDIILEDNEGTIVYFCTGTLLIFFLQIPAAIFYLLPLTLIEETRIQENSVQELLKHYLPLPVIIMSLFFSIFLCALYQSEGSMYLFPPAFVLVYCIITIQLSTYIYQLKS